MLEGFYTCTAKSGDNTRLEADIRLNASHSVYEGHFPGKPVLPGVCQLHIIKELVSSHFGRPMRCTAVRELKFLSPVIPSEETDLRIVLVLTPAENGSVGVQGMIGSELMQKTKIKAIFV